MLNGSTDFSAFRKLCGRAEKPESIVAGSDDEPLSDSLWAFGEIPRRAKAHALVGLLAASSKLIALGERFYGN